MTTPTPTMTLDGSTLTIDATSIELQRLPVDSLIHAWSVPTDYRANGYYVSLQPIGQPREAPASDSRSTHYIGSLEYPADPEAALAAAKAEMHRQRVAALEAARESGFDHDGHTVASDEKSQTLLGALNTEASLALLDGTQAALDQFAAGLGSGWRATDGAIVATDATSFRAMMQSWYAHVATTDANSQAIKAAIDAVTTLAELDAIDVTAGYPDV